ncbi:MAG: HAD family hydrolase [Bacilli bacterium]|nr:HAD family hydrolase [Bacilli bacterium]
MTNRPGIIFDLDGTLWDSREGVRIAWNEVYFRYSGIKDKYTPDDIGGVMGLTMEEISHRLFGNFKEVEAKIAKEAYDYENEYLSKHPSLLFDGELESLEALSKKYDLFIVSNCQVGYIPAFYESMGLKKYFKDEQCYGDNGVSKGENIKILMERNKLAKAFYVGDTLGDEKATRAAGIPFVHAAYGFGIAESPDYTIKEWKELLDVAERILK